MNLDVWYSNKNYFKLLKIFPQLSNYNLYSKIQIDENSYKYITSNIIAEIISKIICIHLTNHGINPKNMTLIELMGGCGGNTISFSWYFNNIISLELSSIRSAYLQNNLNLYDCFNVKVINMCAVEFCNNHLQKHNSNIIFIDPPWGNDWNKVYKNFRITFNNEPFETFLKTTINKINNNPIKLKLIIVKLPKNYDLKYIYTEISIYPNIKQYLYILKKMIIIVFEIQ
jgi:16S rRNA G966 N2-methylase RsmD